MSTNRSSLWMAKSDTPSLTRHVLWPLMTKWRASSARSSTLTDQKDLETSSMRRTVSPRSWPGQVGQARLAFALKSACRCRGSTAGVPSWSTRLPTGLSWSPQGAWKEFTKHFSLYGESGQLARLIMRGKPIYRPYTLAKPLLGELSCDPLARATALLPVHLDEGVGALLVLSSRRLEGITDAAARTLRVSQASWA